MSMTRNDRLARRRACFSVAAVGAQAQAKAPEALIKEVSTDVLDAVKADKTIQAGDLRKVIALVDQKVPAVRQLPAHDGVRRRPATGAQATPEQQKRLQDEFKLLLVRTYSGALSQVSSGAEGRAEADARGADRQRGGRAHRDPRQGRSDPARLPAREGRRSWKIYDVNVLGVWLVENYRNSFAQEIGANGIDGLIAKMAERNKSAAAGAKS